MKQLWTVFAFFGLMTSLSGSPAHADTANDRYNYVNGKKWLCTGQVPADVVEGGTLYVTSLFGVQIDVHNNAKGQLLTAFTLGGNRYAFLAAIEGFVFDTATSGVGIEINRVESLRDTPLPGDLVWNNAKSITYVIEPSGQLGETYQLRYSTFDNNNPSQTGTCHLSKD